MASNKRIDGMLFKEMFISGAALLSNNRESVDALNVFPVPDGDTGTNMSQTINSAVKEINSKPYTSVADVANAAARGALKGARGNSGVILSQIQRGFAKALDGHEDIDGPLLAEALRSGANTAYKAVMKPKEGTILTVARVIAEEAEEAYDKQNDVVELFRLVLSVGDAILKRTPEMLPVLKQAGVVDSGGKGLMVIYRGMYAALTGEPVDVEAEEKPRPVTMPGDFVDDHDAIGDIKFGYCTEFIVTHPRPDMRESDVVRLRRRLERMGDCVLKEYGIVAVALGEGLSEIFRNLNVDEIVDGGQTMNPSIQDLAKAADATNARNVIMLPNNTNIILAAQQASALTDRNVIVLPTKSVPMGISAALAFDPEASLEENEAAMTEAANSVHTASVTYAVRDTNYDGQSIHEGDIMAMIDNKLSVLGSDIPTVCLDVTEKMVNGDSSLITIYYGQDIAEADAQALQDELAEKYPDCDVDLQSGGQPLYYYLIAVE